MSMASIEGLGSLVSELIEMSRFGVETEHRRLGLGLDSSIESARSKVNIVKRQEK